MNLVSSYMNLPAPRRPRGGILSKVAIHYFKKLSLKKNGDANVDKVSGE